MELALIGLLLCLGAVLFQDWNYRHIHIVLPLGIFVACCALVVLNGAFPFYFSMVNAAFFLIILSVLVLYMSLKNKAFLNPFQHYFGLGDVLFYLAVTPLFFPQHYLLYFILSMIFAVLLQLGLRKVTKEKTVPLAGYSALFLMLLIAKDLLLNLPKITLI